MTAKELRRHFIDFYESKGHKLIPNSSLRPDGDSTLLFTNSGMFPLVPYLSGQPHPLGQRIFNIQRCLRVEDIEEVGDRRHSTMFEMIGNWSLGDYFKREQLSQWLEFCVERLGIDASKLYATVFAGDANAPRDEESIDILREIFQKYKVSDLVYPKDINSDTDLAELDSKYRIYAYPAKKNWWKRGDAIGELGGPDSELFYDTGRQHDPSYGPHCHPNCDCGRFIEIGNSVFMQYVKSEEGWEELPQKNVDFGGGFERLAMAVENKSSIFETGIYAPIIQYIEAKTGKKYMADSRSISVDDISFEVVADHIKAATFIIADDILPSNKEQGYVLRRLIRRTIRQGKRLGLDDHFTVSIAELFIEIYAEDYPHFDAGKITSALKTEEDKFQKTINTALREMQKSKPKVRGPKEPSKPIANLVSGKSAFYFFETYGMPLEVYIEELKSMGLIYKEADLISEFQAAQKAHADSSRTASAGMFKGGLADSSEATTKYHTATHLLLAALREVLGDHVTQKGSNNNADRLRFDFSHGEKLTPEQKQKVEDIINGHIQSGIDIVHTEKKYKDAITDGAIGVYTPTSEDEIVSTYRIEGVSYELCGGPHVKNTRELGQFRIKKEESSSAGIRRIKAILE